MDLENPRLWIAVGIVALVAIAIFLVYYLSPEARVERRRRRSNTRVVSTARRPMVKFSVRAPDRDKNSENE